MSGSSPRSDISQPASQDGVRRLMSKRGKWKMFVRAMSPESTSRSSSKTGRETPENGESGNRITHLFHFYAALGVEVGPFYLQSRH